MTGYGGARMKVFLDKRRLQCASFKEYMTMYEGLETPVVFDKIGDRWEVKPFFFFIGLSPLALAVSLLAVSRRGIQEKYVGSAYMDRLTCSFPI